MVRSIATGLARLRFVLLAMMCVLLAMAPALHAQSAGGSGHGQPGRQASFTAGASVGDGRTALALSAGLGFRLSPRLGIELELAYARKLDFTLDLCPAPLVCVLGGQLPVTGRTVSLVPHLVVELPVSRRLRTYLQAGVGAGHIRQRHLSGPRLTAGFPEPVELTRSNRVVAVSFGGGATILVSRRFAVSADLRSLHLFDATSTPDRFIEPSGTLHTLRVGSRLHWRF